MSKNLKDSGIEWIGEIPENWGIIKIASIYKERNEKVSDTDYQALSVTKKGIVLQLENVAKTNNGDNRKLVKKGDFVINSRSDRRGSCGISPYDGSVSLINTVLKPYSIIDNKYYNYVFKSERFADEFYKWGHGIVDDLWSTKWNDMKGIYIPFPKIEEQEMIASYLDEKVYQIDNIISKTMRTVEEYKSYKNSLITEVVMRGFKSDIKLKDSEVDYIGMVPYEWRVTKLKNVVKKLNRPIEPESEILICSNSGNVIFRGDKRIGLVSANEDGYQGVKKGDLLIHGMDTWHGAIAVSEYSGKCTPVVHVCDSDENKKFIAYYLRALAFKKVYKAITNGVRENTSDFRSWGKAGGIVLILPTRLEQDEIVQYLDKKCNEIDELILKKQNLIKEMKDYKNALIYECVTGKKEI